MNLICSQNVNLFFRSQITVLKEFKINCIPYIYEIYFGLSMNQILAIGWTAQYLVEDLLSHNVFSQEFVELSAGVELTTDCEKHPPPTTDNKCSFVYSLLEFRKCHQENRNNL